jgi:hypothetical protein
MKDERRKRLAAADGGDDGDFIIIVENGVRGSVFLVEGEHGAWGPEQARVTGENFVFDRSERDPQGQFDGEHADAGVLRHVGEETYVNRHGVLFQANGGERTADTGRLMDSHAVK